MWYSVVWFGVVTEEAVVPMVRPVVTTTLLLLHQHHQQLPACLHNPAAAAAAAAALGGGRLEPHTHPTADAYVWMYVRDGVKIRKG